MNVRMKNEKRIISLALLFPIILLLAGCVTMSTFQGPETQKPGKAIAGSAMAFTIGDRNQDSSIPSLEIYGRVGLAKNLDAGIKLAGFLSTLGVDLKYRLFNSGKFMGSFDMAFSYSNVKEEDEPEKYKVYGYYPALILGTKKFYFGPKLAYLIGKGNYEDFILEDERLPSKKLIPGFFMGYKIDLFKMLYLVPEITIYHTPGYGLWFYAGMAVEIQ